MSRAAPLLCLAVVPWHQRTSCYGMMGVMGCTGPLQFRERSAAPAVMGLSWQGDPHPCDTIADAVACPPAQGLFASMPLTLSAMLRALTTWNKRAACMGPSPGYIAPQKDYKEGGLRVSEKGPTSMEQRCAAAEQRAEPGPRLGLEGLGVAGKGPHLPGRASASAAEPPPSSAPSASRGAAEGGGDRQRPRALAERERPRPRRRRRAAPGARGRPSASSRAGRSSTTPTKVLRRNPSVTGCRLHPLNSTAPFIPGFEAASAMPRDPACLWASSHARTGLQQTCL